MEINNLIFTAIKYNTTRNEIQNKIFKGEILGENEDGTITIKLPGRGVINGTATLDVSDLVGKLIDFSILSEKDGKILIKPMIEDEVIYDNKEDQTSDNLVDRIISEYKLEDTETNQHIIKTMIKYELPITNENLVDSIKTYKKILELESPEDLDIKLINKQNPESEAKPGLEKDLVSDILASVENYIEPENEMKIRNLNVLKERLEELPKTSPEIKADINKLLLVKDTDSVEGKMSDLKEDLLGDFHIETESIKDKIQLIDILVFLKKEDIKPSINNIKNLKELMDSPEKFMETLMELSEEIAGVDYKPEISRENLEFNKKGLTFKEEDPEELIKEKAILEIEKKSGKKELIIDNPKKLKDISNKTEFIKDMNRDIYFHVIPLSYGENKLEGFINIIKNKNKKLKKDESINLFINLNTKNLGKVKISCVSKLDNLKLNIIIQEDDRELFERYQEGLIAKVEALGFNVSSFKLTYDDKLTLISELEDDSKELHFLDIKV